MRFPQGSVGSSPTFGIQMAGWAKARGREITSIAENGHHPSDSCGHCNEKGPLMGYVFGMFMVVLMLAIGLGAVFFIFGGSNGSTVKDDH